MYKANLSSVLFLDIECVPQQPSFFDLDEGLQELREKKSARLLQSPSIENTTSVDELYDNRSWIFAEFWKIIVISVWYIQNIEWTQTFRAKSFSWDDEKKLLEEFFDMLNTHYTKSDQTICGHNIKEFDIPYICRRALIHWLRLPTILDSTHKKPWEINHLDTLEMRRFGERRSFISLDLLCRILNIPTPKTDISWEQVARVYRDEKDLSRIQQYCERDIYAVAQVLLKFLYNDQYLAYEE